MPLSLKYRVHNANVTAMQRKVLFEGEEIVATVPVLEVELSWDQAHIRDHSCVTLRFVGTSEIAAAQGIFIRDKMVSATFEAEEEEAVAALPAELGAGPLPAPVRASAAAAAAAAG